MTNTSANLARSITWASSKQSYLTARFLADRDSGGRLPARLRLFPLGR